MKKKLFVLSLSLFLVGCSNDKKDAVTSSESTDSSVVKKAPTDKFGFTASSILESNFNELLNDEFKLIDTKDTEGGNKLEVVTNEDETVSILFFTKKDENNLSAYSVTGNRKKETISHDQFLLAMRTLQATESKESKDFKSTWGPDIQSTDVSISSFNSEINSGELERETSKYLSELYSKVSETKEINSADKGKDKQPEVSREFSNAKKKANEYLKVSNFSKEGLYDQLIFEKFPEDAARYAVDNIEVDWSSYAAARAVDYLDVSSFSDEGLYDQLIHDKFTEEQARYAIDNLPK